MFRRTALALGMVVAFGAGCASRGPAAVADPDVITIDQIVKSKATNTYDLIATIRPQMFTAHGAPTTRGDQPTARLGRHSPPVVVYIDNVKVGPVAELKALGTGDVREVRYLSPRVATDRWGLNHAGGVIYVTTIQGLGPDTAQSIVGSS
jgi:hypothetical protein